ncbi:MAG: dihydrofolate reductase family protein [Thermoanaerobaculia bacterium]
MRKLIVCNIISLDGFYSGPGGDVMVMPFDAGFSDYNAERLRAADTLLLGRRTYEGFRAYWPGVAEDLSQPGSGARDLPSQCRHRFSAGR